MFMRIRVRIQLQKEMHLLVAQHLPSNTGTGINYFIAYTICLNVNCKLIYEFQVRFQNVDPGPDPGPLTWP